MDNSKEPQKQSIHEMLKFLETSSERRDRISNEHRDRIDEISARLNFAYFIIFLIFVAIVLITFVIL